MQKKLTYTYAGIAFLLVSIILYALVVKQGDEGWRFVFALLTLVLAGMTWVVAHEQREVAAAKLKIDLFEKRLAIYDKVIDFIEKLSMHVDVPHGHIADYNTATLPAQFLFGPEVVEYIHSLRDRYVEVWQMNRRLAQPVTFNVEDRDELAHEYGRKLTFLHGERYKAAAVFAPYLDLSRWS